MVGKTAASAKTNAEDAKEERKGRGGEQRRDGR
jgi:hypothetical protein